MPTPEQWYTFWRMGDVNLDGKIDSKDLDFISNFVGKWHPSADINEDNIVNETDLQLAATNYGLNIWSYFGIIHYPDWLPIALILGFAVVIVGGAYILLKRRS